MEDCIFCKIIKGEIPSTKVYEDENVLAFKYRSGQRKRLIGRNLVGGTAPFSKSQSFERVAVIFLLYGCSNKTREREMLYGSTFGRTALCPQHLGTKTDGESYQSAEMQKDSVQSSSLHGGYSRGMPLFIRHWDGS